MTRQCIRNIVRTLSGSGYRATSQLLSSFCDGSCISGWVLTLRGRTLSGGLMERWRRGTIAPLSPLLIPFPGCGGYRAIDGVYILDRFLHDVDYCHAAEEPRLTTAIKHLFALSCLRLYLTDQRQQPDIAAEQADDDADRLQVAAAGCEVRAHWFVSLCMGRTCWRPGDHSVRHATASGFLTVR